MKTLEDELNEVMRQKAEKSAEIDRFTKASSDYEKMIDAGLTSRRGYNLMTICDPPKVRYNMTH